MVAIGANHLLQSWILSRFGTEREVDEVNDNMLQFEFDHQLLHAPLKIVKCFVADAVSGEEGIALFLEDGDASPERIVAVFDRMCVVVAKHIGKLLCLVFAV